MSKGFIGWLRRYISPVFVIVAGLYAYVLFFNDNSYFNLSVLKAQARDLRREIAADRDTMLHYRELNRLLESSPAEMERIAREHFHMQRVGEDIYIFEN